MQAETESKRKCEREVEKKGQIKTDADRWKERRRTCSYIGRQTEKDIKKSRL